VSSLGTVLYGVLFLWLFTGLYSRLSISVRLRPDGSKSRETCTHFNVLFTISFGYVLMDLSVCIVYMLYRVRYKKFIYVMFTIVTWSIVSYLAVDSECSFQLYMLQSLHDIFIYVKFIHRKLVCVISCI
jgi:hypothetical protein